MSIYKPDIESAKKNWDDFWKGNSARPMLEAVIPKPGMKPVEKSPYASGHDGNFAPVCLRRSGE